MTALGGVNGTVCNATQYNQYQEFRNNGGGPAVSCLTRGEGIGLAVSILSVSLRLELIQFTVNSRSVVHQFH
jgi:hypothetical protein